MMFKLILTLLLMAFSLQAQGLKRHLRPEAGSLTTYFDQVIPLVIVGEGWGQRLILTNVDDSTQALGTVTFFTQAGQLWTVNSSSNGRNSIFAFALQPGQTYVLDLPASQGNQQLGWALIEETSTGLGDFLGQVVFRKQTAGLPDFMTSMVLGGRAFDKLTVFFDNTGGNYTGMGVLSSEHCLFSCDVPVTLKVTVQDLTGRTISTKNITQKKGELYWMNLGIDFPETNGRMGMFVVEPVTRFSTYLTGFSLQFAGNGAFTVITPFEN